MKPLHDVTLLYTRPLMEDDAYAGVLMDAGATLLRAPVIAFEPTRNGQALVDAVQSADALLLTSPRAVSVVAAHVKPGTPVYPLAGSTAEQAKQAGLHVVELDATDGAALGHALVKHLDVRGKRFTLPTSDVAEPAVSEVLRFKGAQVVVVEAYRTVPIRTFPDVIMTALTTGRVNAVLCMSPSAVDALVALTGVELLRPLVRAAPGETTARAWKKHGLDAAVTASIPTAQSLLDAWVQLPARNLR